MNFLTEFRKDFWESRIPIRQYFSSPEGHKLVTLKPDSSVTKPDSSVTKVDSEAVVDEICDDVVHDLVQKPIASACLPIAKQISTSVCGTTSDQILRFKLPQIGDLFIGILHLPIIAQVNFRLHNYSEEYHVEGLCQQIGQQSIWTLSDLPLPLVCVSDWVNCSIDVEIELNDNYSLHVANQDVFKAFYGYCQRSILYQIVNQALYEIPLHNGVSQIKIICGLWTIPTPSKY
jgi:hypothetical protein